MTAAARRFYSRIWKGFGTNQINRAHERDHKFGSKEKMSGQNARAGFRFQDSYLLFRVLQGVVTEFNSKWDNLDALASTFATVDQKFGIEAKPRAPGESRVTESLHDWDVFVCLDTYPEWIEVKSGQISKEDRERFWRRMRELLKALVSGEELIPVLAADPDKLPQLDYWLNLRQYAQEFAGNLPSTEPPQVRATSDLLTEALWWLCRAPERDAGSPAVAQTQALAALCRFQLHLHREAELESKVEALVQTASRLG
jgi:hypothetical protein